MPMKGAWGSFARSTEKAIMWSMEKAAPSVSAAVVAE